jgi:Suppressor of fused protein (SUFU)
VVVPTYETVDPVEALQRHLTEFFTGHVITEAPASTGPIESRIPGFFVYEVRPGPRFPGWTYVSAGCWQATANQERHGLEFVLSTRDSSARHVEIVTIAAYYHAGPGDQRLDWAHTVPIGEPWVPGGTCDAFLVSEPYAYGPDLERCAWSTGHLQILSLMPITDSERQFKAAHGVEELEQRLEDAAVDFLDPARPPGGLTAHMCKSRAHA